MRRVRELVHHRELSGPGARGHPTPLEPEMMDIIGPLIVLVLVVGPFATVAVAQEMAWRRGRK